MKDMRLTKDLIEEAIALEEAWSDYLASNSSSGGSTGSLDYQSGNWRNQIFEAEATPQCENLKKFLRVLSEIQFLELKVFMWIGRGEGKPEEFRKICDETTLGADREEEVCYMIEKMEAANYLRDGFEKLNTARII